MVVQRRMQFVQAQSALMLAVLIGLALLDALTLRFFFLFSFLGFLLLTEITAPFAVAPQWRRRLRWVIVVGFLGLVALVALRAIEVLSLGWL